MSSTLNNGRGLFLQTISEIDFEAAIDLLNNHHDKNPEGSLVTNTAIAASLLAAQIKALDENSEVVQYLFELTTMASMDPMFPASTPFDSMMWATLVTWTGKVKPVVAPVRKVITERRNASKQKSQAVKTKTPVIETTSSNPRVAILATTVSTPTATTPFHSSTPTATTASTNFTAAATPSTGPTAIAALETNPMPATSAAPSTHSADKPKSFKWKTANYPFEPPLVAGAVSQFIQQLKNDSFKSSEIFAILSAVEKAVVSGTSFFTDMEHLISFKPCCMHFTLRLSRLGFKTHVEELNNKFYPNLLSLLAPFCFNEKRNRLEQLVSSDDFSHGAVSNDLKDVFATLALSENYVDLGVQILRFLVSECSGLNSGSNQSANDWLSKLMKRLKIIPYSFQSSESASALQSAYHVLQYVWMNQEWDSVHFPVTDDDCEDTFVNYSVPVEELKALRLVMNALIRVQFQRSAVVEFWAAWPFKPIGADHVKFFNDFNVPVASVPVVLPVKRKGKAPVADAVTEPKRAKVTKAAASRKQVARDLPEPSNVASTTTRKTRRSQAAKEIVAGKRKTIGLVQVRQTLDIDDASDDKVESDTIHSSESGCRSIVDLE
ncbi:hypothetical protein BDR26DRAFT_879562 [Obelidium mucronatum]|nr:hypothetical protein BDR26DRAFT_879562 [Obelidium mucronatum]